MHYVISVLSPRSIPVRGESKTSDRLLYYTDNLTIVVFDLMKVVGLEKFYIPLTVSFQLCC
jgi:hypothetical protein